MNKQIYVIHYTSTAGTAEQSEYVFTDVTSREQIAAFDDYIDDKRKRGATITGIYMQGSKINLLKQ